MSSKYMILVALLGLSAITCHAVNMQSMIDEENAKCESGTDSMACVKVRAMRLVDTVMTKDEFKISNVEVKSNGYQSPASEARSTGNFFDVVEKYLQGHDVTMDLPMADAKVTVSSRNLANDELNLNVKFAGDGVVEGKGKKGGLFKKGKKHRLRKMAMPIMVLILLKAITIIPMAIGILKIKAMNALGLGFFSFIVSVGLAIFQVCKKIAHEHHSAHITAHGPWDGRSVSSIPSVEQFETIPAAQNLAYNAYNY
ncbi:uncharacterized protein LOC106082249 isoform X1 [Stomoxys calcitrans]|uniref:uncharacterized protein LOC106082249 isoform X1 n=1 Tax=Stomoxys calcitrans TaxID=35570 RepID=UPI0027E31991|nr:uncharacterized protein LOC106082249 isoform X1 [Stomoxys calcitrans]